MINMSAKLVLRVEWNETVQTRTCRDPFDIKKFSNLSPEILVQWIAPSDGTYNAELGYDNGTTVDHPDKGHLGTGE